MPSTGVYIGRVSEHSAAGGAVFPLIAFTRHQVVPCRGIMQVSTMAHAATALAIQTDDAALVAALQAGSEDAFALLIAQYHQPIYSVIARSLHDPADAADITQDVFLKVFRGIHSFHGDSSLRTWLYRIALHEASNQRRWWSRHKKNDVTIDAELSSDDDANTFCLRDTLEAHDDSPFDRAAQSETHARVEAALRQVPEVFRTVLVLREIEGLAYEEIAEILNTNLGTVKSRITRGRSALKDILLHDATAEADHRRTLALQAAQETKNVGCRTNQEAGCPMHAASSHAWDASTQLATSAPPAGAPR